MNKYPDYPASILRWEHSFNIGLTSIFTLEILIKITAMGLNQFWSQRLNQLDLIVILTSLTDIILCLNYGLIFRTPFWQIIRCVRAIRVFRLLQFGKFQVLNDAVAIAATDISSYIVILLLIIYIFAVLAMNLFGG